MSAPVISVSGLGKRYFLNGWAGFFAAKTQSFYAFLKYAKVLEAQRQSRE